MSQLALQGVVFDVDGVLFDTERLTNQTWLAVGKELGWPQIGEYYLEFVGQNRTDIHQKMLDLFGPEFPKEEFMKTCSAYSQARMEREGVPMKPGVREILDFLKSRNIPIALATSTGRERTLRPHGANRPRFLLLRHHYRRSGGPQQARPEIYQLACRALGTDPAQTIAVEDSRNGILSASQAGMKVIMVPDMIPLLRSWMHCSSAAVPACWRCGTS